MTEEYIIAGTRFAPRFFGSTFCDGHYHLTLDGAGKRHQFDCDCPDRIRQNADIDAHNARVEQTSGTRP